MFVRCYFALCASFGSARNLHLEVFDDAEVLQEVAQVPLNLRLVKSFVERFSVTQKQCDLLSVDDTLFQLASEKAAQPTLIQTSGKGPGDWSQLQLEPIISKLLDAHGEEVVRVNNGRFGAGKVHRQLQLQRYLQQSSSDFHVFTVNRPRQSAGANASVIDEALARGEDVDALAAAAGVTVPATKKGPAAMSKQPIVPKAPETTETTPCPVPIQTEEVKPPEAIPRAEAVVKAAPQPPVPQETPAEEEDEDDFPGLGGAEMANRGFGRGRPMGRFSEGPFLGRGMGRGRALAPPPGLQGLHLSGSQRLPATLSRPWMAGIPEDEDVTTTPQNVPWPEPQHRWSSIPSLDLPQSTSQRRAWADMDSGSEVSYSELKGGQMSYVPTPKQKWSKTPSPPSSPAGLPDALTLQSLPCSVPSAIGPLGMNPAVKDGPDQNDYVIPVYVTVPIAVAKCCPHCGKHFAEMPPREDLPGG